MNLLGRLMWRASVRRAMAVEPIAEPKRAVMVHQGHWTRSLPTARSAPTSSAAAENLPGLYLQTRNSRLRTITPTLADSLSLLSATATVRDSGRDVSGREWESRLAPSAGGTHSIEPLLFHEDCWFVSHGDRIRAVELDPTQTRSLMTDLEQAARVSHLTCALFAIADPQLLFQRYPKGESLLWRDAGAFVTTAQFTALALGLESRIVGCSRLLNKRGTACVGALILGAR
jgi:hypothetical protein